MTEISDTSDPRVYFVASRPLPKFAIASAAPEPHLHQHLVAVAATFLHHDIPIPGLWCFPNNNPSSSPDPNVVVRQVAIPRATRSSLRAIKDKAGYRVYRVTSTTISLRPHHIPFFPLDTSTIPGLPVYYAWVRIIQMKVSPPPMLPLMHGDGYVTPPESSLFPPDRDRSALSSMVRLLQIRVGADQTGKYDDQTVAKVRAVLPLTDGRIVGAPEWDQIEHAYYLRLFNLKPKRWRRRRKVKVNAQ